MKKLSKLSFTSVICLLLSVLITISAYSIPIVAGEMSEDEIKAIIRANAQGGSLEPDASLASPGSISTIPVISTKTVDEVKALTRANSTLSSHEHDNVTYFTESGTTWGLCLVCGAYIAEPSQTLNVSGSESVVMHSTSAEIRSSCVHQFQYYTLGSETHHKVCPLCSYSVIEDHWIVEASCTHHQHCVICGHHEEDWDKMLDHEIGIIANILEGTHTYRCVRRDNDGEFYCNHIESTVPCSWSNSYIDPPINGEHNIWQDCTVCDNVNYLGSYPCTLPDYCVYPH